MCCKQLINIKTHRAIILFKCNSYRTIALLYFFIRSDIVLNLKKTTLKKLNTSKVAPQEWKSILFIIFIVFICQKFSTIKVLFIK